MSERRYRVKAEAAKKAENKKEVLMPSKALVLFLRRTNPRVRTTTPRPNKTIH